MLNLGTFTSPAKKRISLIPLIDIVFILLLFFLLTTTVVRDKQITIESSQPVDSDMQAPVNITLETEDGVISDGEVTVDSANRDELVQWVRTKGRNRTYSVDVSSEVSTQALIDLLDQLNKVGVTATVALND